MYKQRHNYSPDSEQRIVKRYLELCKTAKRGDKTEFAQGYGVSLRWLQRKAKLYAQEVTA